MFVKNIWALTFTLLSCLACTQLLAAMSWTDEAEHQVPQVERDEYAKKFVATFDSYAARINASRVAIERAERNEQERVKRSALQKICFGIMRRNTAQQVKENICSNDAVRIIKNSDVLKIIGDYAQETHYSLSDNQFWQGCPAAQYFQSLPAHDSRVAIFTSIESHATKNGIENLVFKNVNDHKDMSFFIKPEYTSVARTCLWNRRMDQSNFGTISCYNDNTGYLVHLPTTNKNDARYRYIQIDNPSTELSTQRLRSLGFLR